MKRRWLLLILVSLGSLLPHSSAYGSGGAEPGAPEVAQLTAKEIIFHSENRPTGDTSVSVLTLTLIDKAGSARTRAFTWYHRSTDEGDQDLQKFFFPNNIKNVGTLNEEVKEAEDRQYLYLPAGNRVRRVSSKYQAWMGSDLIYEDLQKLDLSQWVFTLVETSREDGFPVYVVDGEPVTETVSAYGRRRYYIRSDGSYFPSRVDFYSKSGALVKRVERQDVVAYGDILYERLVKVTDLQTNHRTELNRKWLLLNQGLSAADVSVRQLEKDIERYTEPSELKQVLDQVTRELASAK